MLIDFNTVDFALRLAIANGVFIYSEFRHKLACGVNIKSTYLVQDWTFAIRESEDRESPGP